jgi:hypothetical protein
MDSCVVMDPCVVIPVLFFLCVQCIDNPHTACKMAENTETPDTPKKKTSTSADEALMQRLNQPFTGVPGGYAPPMSAFTPAAVNLSPEDLAELPFPCHPPGQNWAVISCVAPKGWNTLRTANCLAFRIYGLYETEEDANRAMRKAKNMGYKFFDMHTVDIRQGFIPLPPPEGCEIETSYDHPILHQIMRGHRDILNESSERILARVHETPSAKLPELQRACQPKETKQDENVVQLKPIPPRTGPQAILPPGVIREDKKPETMHDTTATPSGPPPAPTASQT